MRYHMQASALIDGTYLYESERIPNYLIGERGEVFSPKVNRYQRDEVYHIGYRRNYINGKRTYQHQIVATMFLYNPLDKPEVNHLDGNKSNNFVGNLEWSTRKENQLHASKEGLFNPLKGEAHRNSPLKESDVLEIRSLAGKLLRREIAEKFGISQPAVSNIINRKTWAHI